MIWFYPNLKNHYSSACLVTIFLLIKKKIIIKKKKKNTHQQDFFQLLNIFVRLKTENNFNNIYFDVLKGKKN